MPLFHRNKIDDYINHGSFARSACWPVATAQTCHFSCSMKTSYFVNQLMRKFCVNDYRIAINMTHGLMGLKKRPEHTSPIRSCLIIFPLLTV